MELATKYAELKEFTFYFIYINTGNLEDVVDNNINLHSTLFILIR